MKLEGDRAFCHPNIGLEPESQSFEFNDCNPESIIRKSISDKVKENDKRISFDLKSNDQNSIPTQYDMGEVDVLIASKLVFPSGIVDLENNDEACNARRSHDVWIHDSPEELDSCENSEDTHSDECVTESQAEMIVCCKESNCHLIKDICVDEGVPSIDEVRYDNIVDEKDVSKFLPFETLKAEVMEKDNREIILPSLNILDQVITKEPGKVPDIHHQSEDLIQRDENASKNFGDQNKDMGLPGSTILLQEIEPEARPFCDKGEVELSHAEVSSEPDSHFKHEEYEEARNKVEEAELANPSVSNLESDILVWHSNLVLEDSVVCCSNEECHLHGSCKCDDFQITAKPEDERPITSQVPRCNGESSFSAEGVSSHICYSGPIPFSGNISLRSDSSTASMHSFAFPILQHEWDSSPVRMATADKRHHHRRHKSWREGLLCCRF